MPNYRRRLVPGGTYFFTVNLLNRNQTLLTDHANLLRAAFTSVKNDHPFDIDAIVILPDHLHCIWTLPRTDADFSTRWRQIKSYFSRNLPRTEPRSRVRRRKNERGVWQRRFWEHAITDDTDFVQHVDYIHYNPVKHGHADTPIDWPYSSFHRYVKDGILDPRWGTVPPKKDLNLE